MLIAIPHSDPDKPVTTNKGITASLTEAQHQPKYVRLSISFLFSHLADPKGSVNSGIAPPNNAQLHPPSSSTSMLTQWLYETHESKLTWTEKWQQR
jgi:hypothetical protein